MEPLSIIQTLQLSHSFLLQKSINDHQRPSVLSISDC